MALVESSSTPSAPTVERIASGVARWRISSVSACAVLVSGAIPELVGSAETRLGGRSESREVFSRTWRSVIVPATWATAMAVASRASAMRRQVEVAVGDDLPVIGENQRVVGGTGQLGLQRGGQQVKGHPQGAVDLADAAEAQRVLEAPGGARLGRARRRPAARAGRPPPTADRVTDGRRSTRGSSGERLARKPSIESAADTWAARSHASPSSQGQRGGSHRGRRARADGQPVLGAERHRLETRPPQGLRGRRCARRPPPRCPRRSAPVRRGPSCTGRPRPPSRCAGSSGARRR